MRSSSALATARVLVLALLATTGISGIFSGPLAQEKSTAATITVTSTADSGPGTLRQALLDAVNGDTITFAPVVFPPSSPATIAPASALPEIDQGGLTVDGSDAGVILDGSGIGATPETLMLDDVSLTLDGGTNLIANGDFGAGFGHWRPWDERPGATRSLNSSDFHSSPNSYQWNVVAQALDSGTVYDTADTSNPADDPFDDSDSTAWIPTTGGSTLELRFWYRYGDVDVTLHVLFLDDEDKLGDWWFDAENDWTEVVISETLPGDAIGVGISLGHAHSLAGTGGLSISSNSNAIRGLQVVSFPGTGVVIYGGAQGNVIGGDSTAGAGPMGQGNLISGNSGSGVSIHDSGTMSNAVSGNYVGTDASGIAAMGNGAESIHVADFASYNLIGGVNGTPGGACSGECNLISGNDDGGIEIEDGATNNTVSGNYIGTDASGTMAVGNDRFGIGIDKTSGNTIGGDTPGERNVISGNGEDGVSIDGYGAMYNTVSGNYIGTDVNGKAALPNEGVGIQISNWASHNLIGGDTPGERNVISGNVEDGVHITESGSTGNMVSGNYIGTDASGRAALPNEDSGVRISEEASDNIIGGVNATPETACTGECNLISSNGEHGIATGAWPTLGPVNCTVSGNYIGTDVTGAIPLGNGGDGVHLYYGASGNRIGGDSAGERNVIGGNEGNGIDASYWSDGNELLGNYVGVAADGLGELGNEGTGVSVFNNEEMRIERNIIANNGEGIALTAFVESNSVRANLIGVNAAGAPAGNQGAGVHVGYDSRHNTIGGPTPLDGNVIAHNATGVRVKGEPESGKPTDQNPISHNSIYSNISLGIELLRGANDGILPPVIDYTDTASGLVSGTACAKCTVEVFSDDAEEGRVFEGMITAEVDGSFAFTKPGGFTGPNLHATATDADGNTSDFSHETNDPWENAFTLVPDAPYLSFLSHQRDVDWYKVFVPEGSSTLSVALDDLPADYELVLFSDLAE
ncbi:MAG: hypothetical protein PVG25_09740, partial [Anaerolineae bacterium]